MIILAEIAQQLRQTAGAAGFFGAERTVSSVAGENNLKPIRSVDEARAKGKKGGKASAKARREKALLRDAADLLLRKPIIAEDDISALEAMGVPKTARTLAMAAVAGMVIAAGKGDAKAFAALMKLRGEGLERQEVALQDKGQLASLLEDRRRSRTDGDG
jgi:Tfp pilus assembly ATPase PilU